MTLIHFTYSTGYHRPAVGGVVFMPHRKHAANETTVLPKPFTRPLVNGVVEVDLEPTGDDWLWSVTHDRDTRFYAIPDTDGVINHTELIPVAPSTLTRRIEPVWWAELRQHQQFIADYVNESRSSVHEALDTVNTAHTTLQTAVTDAQRHESVAGAYSRQAQVSNEQAWEASKGPDGAAERAKTEADRSEIYRNEANTHRVEAGVEANRAENHASNARADYERIQEYTEGWDSLDDAITDARVDADRSATHANESATARNEAFTARNEAFTARDESVEARDRSEVAAQSLDYIDIDEAQSIQLQHNTVTAPGKTLGVTRTHRTDAGDIFDADVELRFEVNDQHTTAQNPPGYNRANIRLIEHDDHNQHRNPQHAEIRVISNRVVLTRRLEIEQGGNGRPTLSGATTPDDQFMRWSFHNSAMPRVDFYGEQHANEGNRSSFLVDEAYFRVRDPQLNEGIRLTRQIDGSLIESSISLTDAGRGGLVFMKDRSEQGSITWDTNNIARIRSDALRVESSANIVGSLIADSFNVRSNHITLRRPDGVLVQIGVDNDNNLTVTEQQ